MKFLALDFGSKRIGLALCDADERLAWPHRTHHRQPNDNRGDIAAILEAARTHEVGGIVCGIPGGSANSEQTAQIARRFFEKLKSEAQTQGLELGWHEWDERFSTAAFLTQLRESGSSVRQAKIKGDVDAGAAAMMLEGFLDSRRADREREA